MGRERVVIEWKISMEQDGDRGAGFMGILEDRELLEKESAFRHPANR
jgi:hypothetical protein